MSNKSQVPGCLKYGCVGCLSALALSVVLIFLVSAIHLSSEPEDPRPEETQVEHQLPEPPELPALPSLPGGDRPAIGEVQPLEGLAASDPRVGQVILDLRMGEFRITPGPAGEPIRVEADYDASAFELSEEFTHADDGSWSYEVSFGGERGLLGLILDGNRHNVDNRVEIIIPRGHPIDIVGEVGLGEFEADLGGLLVRHVDLELGAGDHFVEFRDPPPYPLQTFRVDASMGNVEVRSLGDASPRLVEVEQGIGELFLDLKGAWRDDAEVDVDFGIGECRVWLPDDVRVEVERAGVSIGESFVDRPSSRPLPDDAPTLTVAMRGNIGEVSLEY